MCSPATTPPSSPQVGGSHACSIQHIPAHINALMHKMPYQGCPVSTFAAAITSPCAGKYIDIYVGCMLMWKLSKWIHIAGVGLVNLPEAKVSAASRKLKSSGTNGRGIGQTGRIARRSRRAVKPTTATAKPRLRANCPKALSTREKNPEPSLGQPNATAAAINVRPPSIIIRDALPL